MTDLAVALAAIPRASLATLPTPLQKGMLLPGGARLLVKRDDLSGLGMGGNKARKLELLCGAALADGADALVTVGAEQSNHPRMTAAAGAILGIETHLVLGGDPGAVMTGNRLLGRLFGARVHQPGTDDWSELSQALEALVAELRAGGRRPYAIPMGGSTEIGALGFTAAWCELRRQLEDRGQRPATDRPCQLDRWHPRGPARRSGSGRGDRLSGVRHPQRRGRRRDTLGGAPRRVGARPHLQRQGVRMSAGRRCRRSIRARRQRRLLAHGWPASGLRARWGSALEPRMTIGRQTLGRALQRWRP
jgi:Pyridoxal-phosphate dependent enzyme